MPSSKESTREALRALYVFCGLALWIWWDKLLGWRAPFYDTLYLLFYPNAEFFRRNIRALEFPFWNPHLYCGVPFMANLQSAVFYPFTYLHAFLDYPTALTWNLCIHSVMASWFMHLCGRRLSMSNAGALLAGIVFSLNGNFVMRYAYPSNYHSYVWLPLALYFFPPAISRNGNWNSPMEYASGKPMLTMGAGGGDGSDRPTVFGRTMGPTADRLRAGSTTFPAVPGALAALAAAAAALALQILAGHPPSVLYAGMVLGLYCVLSEDRKRLIPFFCGAYALAFLLAAIQLVPSLHFARQSVRASGFGYDWASSYSIHPKEFLVMLAAPQWIRYFTPAGGDQHVVGFYFGPVALACATLALRGHRKQWLPFAAIAVLGSVLALGRHLPLYKLLFDHVWPFGWLRFPAQSLYMVCFALAALAGMGLDRLPSKYHRLALILCALDLGFFARRSIVTIDPSVYKDEPPIMTLLKEKAGTDRVFLTPRTREVQRMSGRNEAEAWLRFKDTLKPNLGMALGLYMADGREEMRYARYEQVLDRLSQDPLSPWMDVLGIRYVLTFWDMPTSKFRLINDVDKTTTSIYENFQAFPKTYLASTSTYVPDLEDADQIIRRGSTELLRSVLVHDHAPARDPTSAHEIEPTRKPSLAPPSSPKHRTSGAIAPGDVRILRYSAGRVSLETTSRQPAWLVLTDAYDQGWHAEVNHKPVPVRRVNYVQRGVEVRAGQSIVEFHYLPPYFSTAVFLSLSGWLLAIFCLLRHPSSNIRQIRYP